MPWSVDAESKQEDSKGPRKYKKNFNKPVQSSKGTLEPESYVHVPEEFYGPFDQKPKLAAITRETFRVELSTDTTVVVQMDGK